MILLRSNSIALPLVQKFIFFLSKGVFPDTWKMTNIISVQKKEAKYSLKNYRPISPLPIFTKVFKIRLFNSIFFHFHSNKLFTKFQSGFMPRDSFMSQLLSIVHEIQPSFN